MRMVILIAASLTWCMATQGQAIPKQVWGKWIVSREIPTTTISCWDETEARVLLGTEIEYSAEAFRWKNVVTAHPVAEAEMVSAEQFHGDNSGRGANSSQITFRQLGIKAKQAMQITIHHPPGEYYWGNNRNSRRRIVGEKQRHHRFQRLQHLL